MKVVALACLVLALLAPGAVLAQPALEGVWELERYRLASGEVHPVAGTIFFAAGRWQVVFFVLDAAGEPQRGSAEGGAYELQGESLTFRHRLHFAYGTGLPGLPAQEATMTVRAPADEAVEPARAVIAGDRLTLSFPSGNVLELVRAS